MNHVPETRPKAVAIASVSAAATVAFLFVLLSLAIAASGIDPTMTLPNSPMDFVSVVLAYVLLTGSIAVIFVVVQYVTAHVPFFISPISRGDSR